VNCELIMEQFTVHCSLFTQSWHPFWM